MTFMSSPLQSSKPPATASSSVLANAGYDK
jgi:hypothetical protein